VPGGRQEARMVQPQALAVRWTRIRQDVGLRTHPAACADTQDHGETMELITHLSMGLVEDNL
jgi:hypothetical protein